MAMTKRDLYESVTSGIVAELERGVAPWVRPWKTVDARFGGGPYNGATQRGYRGINVWLLFTAARQRGFQDVRWFTYRQAQALKGHVRRGEKSTEVVFWKQYEVASVGAAEDAPKKKGFLLRSYNVFNAEQCEGIAPLEAVPEQPSEVRYKLAATLLARHDARVRHGGNEAFYTQGYDFIQMPLREAFEGEEHYWGTLLHELVHWTGHKDRLARDLGGRFRSERYAAEELVAEMGAAFLCAALGIEGRLRHPEYIGNWLTVLKNDKRAVFKASSLAQAASDFLLGTAGEEDESSPHASEATEDVP
jgi:antirestriction protein ArdC